MRTLMKILGIAVTVIVIVVGLGIVFAFPTMLLWNWLMPDIFGLPEISFFQAMGLLILSGMLVKSSSSGAQS